MIVRTSTIAAMIVLCLGTLANCAWGDSGSWVFLRGPYSHSGKSGQRVEQYSQDAPAYRDPNAVFDSPSGVYPFAPDAGEQTFQPLPGLINNYHPFLGPGFGVPYPLSSPGGP